ncbi:metal dependent hydrolase, putative, partial [Entamoeba invadens IP1]
MPITLGDVTIRHIRHSGILIEAPGIEVYIDPFQLDKVAPETLSYLETHKATHVVCTHTHFDHLSVPDIEKIKTDKTIFIGPDACAELKTKFGNQL